MNNTANTASFVTIASGTYPAGNATQPGACYELYCNGTMSTGTAVILTLQVQFGGNAMCNVSFTTGAFANGNPMRWVATARVYCASTGAAGSFSSEITGVISSFNTNLNGTAGGTGASLPFTSNDTPGPTTIDTTSAQNLNLQAQWGSTTGSPSMACRLILFRRVA